MELNTEDWIESVAKSVGVSHDVARDVLLRYGIGGPKAVPTRRQLRVEAVHFAGVKNLTSDKETRRFVPFSFHRSFTTHVTAFVSDGKNDAGKSSTLDIIAWGLRGSSKVPGDVQKWLRQVSLLLTISGERILIAWRVVDGVPRGWILVIPDKVRPELEKFSLATADAMADHSDQAANAGEPIYTLEAPVESLVERLVSEGAFVARQFNGNEAMATAVGDFMMQRLGLDVFAQWTRVAGATDVDDGGLVGHRWPLWSQALSIAKPSSPATIGETPFQAQNVLNTFLSTEWSATKFAARAHKKAIDGQLAGIVRRRTRDSESREANAEELRAERATAMAQLDSLPESGWTAEEVEAAMKSVVAASASITQTQRALADSALAYGSAERRLEEAEQDLAAFKEAAVTKRFWHALKPSCCPRCDAKVQPAQWQREQEGACSLCNNPISDVDVTPDLDQSENTVDDDLDPVALAEQRVNHHTAEVERLSVIHDDAMGEAKAAEARFARASEDLSNVHGDPIERRVVERRIAVLDGRILERSQPTAAEPEELALSTDSNILEAVESFANSSAKSDFSKALKAVSAQITTLGKRLGINNLEKATLQANAHLPIIKGGEKFSFGKATDGEKLRLKIALVVSLLDVGTTSGLGRHPGFLIVDSLATEELNLENAELLLRELSRVAETYGLQVITSTVHSDLVTSVLPIEAVQTPTANDLMW